MFPSHNRRFPAHEILGLLLLVSFVSPEEVAAQTPQPGPSTTPSTTTPPTTAPRAGTPSSQRARPRTPRPPKLAPGAIPPGNETLPEGDQPPTPAAPGTPSTPATPGTPSASTGKSVAPERPRWLFPDWPSAGFDWGGYPVIGFRYADDRQTRTRTSTIEAGLGVQASGIPIKEGNPGASIAPSAGYALGFVTLVPEAGKTQTGVYHRIWGGLEVPILVKFTRSTLGLRYGQINGTLVEKSKMGGFTFDEGLLVLPYFATHYTYEYLRLFRTAWGSPAIVSNDNWFSLRFFTRFLNSRVAIGPGVTFSKFYIRPAPASESTALYADTRTDYLRLAAASDLFWKLRANLDSRYIIDVNRKEGGLIEEVAQTRLPDQSLSDGPALPLYPKDTLLTSAFFGIKGLIGGLGFGYRYTLEVFDLNAQGGRKTRRRESSGVGLIYEAKF